MVRNPLSVLAQVPRKYLGSRGLRTAVYHRGLGHADFPDSPQEELMTTDQTTGAYPTRP